MPNKQKNTRKYSLKVIKKLYALSGNLCSNPNCRCELIDIDYNGAHEIAHIKAINEGGLRYDGNISNKEVNDISNLILLCPNCHTRVDEDPSTYTLESLCRWKKESEEHTRKLAKIDKIENKSELLLTAIEAISSIDLDDNETEIVSYEPFRPEDKIQYNDLKRNRHLINRYKVYYAKVESIYKNLENNNPFKKEKLLFIINKIYITEKSKITNGNDDINIIIQNSDLIFENVERELRKKTLPYFKSSDDVEIALPIIMVDAFIRCKILEDKNARK